jgi:hypothetical protein
MTLRRNPSFNEKRPSSATSSRFTFNHLLASPPPSPSLPALIPRHGKPPPSPTPRIVRRIGRLLLWLAGLSAILYTFSLLLDAYRHPRTIVQSTSSTYELVASSTLPDFPTPLVVTDPRGRTHWTVSIPPSHPFPLSPNEYAEICAKTAEVSNHVADLHRHKHVDPHFSYYHVDPYFLDVSEASQAGLLISASEAAGPTWIPSPLIGESPDPLHPLPLCPRTLTLVLETPSAGLGPTLLLLWTAYGLALSENRTFFLDDTRWAYGRYTSFFAPPPPAPCRPPPRHEMLPCPHHARHLLVSSATATHVFGASFTAAFEDTRKIGIARQRPIFDLTRAGYDALFRLPADDAAYVRTRLRALRTQAGEGGRVVGVHVRHGDMHPLEFQYADSYIPLDRYAAVARELAGPPSISSQPVIVLASDDPDVYTAPEFAAPEFERAQSLVGLASASVPAEAKPPTAVAAPGFTRFVEAEVGWEGGFFAGVFWSLGREKGVVGEEAMRLRGLVARSYLLDLAVVGASEAVVCTGGSAACRVVAVMMGWERGVENGGWRNVDGEGGWWGGSL